jgi:hypothetical protein
LADSTNSEDGKTLRVNLKYPGKSVFSVWPPEDERLTKVFGIPAANLTSARKTQQTPLNVVDQQYNQDQYRQKPPIGQVEPTCRRRFDHLTLYSAYGFGIPEVLAEFFDQNLGLFILLLTVSVTITAVFGKHFLLND